MSHRQHATWPPYKRSVMKDWNERSTLHSLTVSFHRIPSLVPPFSSLTACPLEFRIIGTNSESNSHQLKWLKSIQSPPPSAYLCQRHTPSKSGPQGDAPSPLGRTDVHGMSWWNCSPCWYNKKWCTNYQSLRFIHNTTPSHANDMHWLCKYATQNNIFWKKTPRPCLPQCSLHPVLHQVSACIRNRQLLPSVQSPAALQLSGGELQLLRPPQAPQVDPKVRIQCQAHSKSIRAAWKLTTWNTMCRYHGCIHTFIPLNTQCLRSCLTDIL